MRARGSEISRRYLSHSRKNPRPVIAAGPRREESRADDRARNNPREAWLYFMSRAKSFYRKDKMPPDAIRWV